MHDLPREVLPPGSRDESAADGGADGFGSEAEQLGALGEGRTDGRRDARGIRLHRQSRDGGVDVLQGVVGFEEEVAGQVEVGDAPPVDLEIDDDELSARNLVLTVHGSSLGAGHARAGTRASNQVTRSLTTSSRETSLKISCRTSG